MHKSVPNLPTASEVGVKKIKKGKNDEKTMRSNFRRDEWLEQVAQSPEFAKYFHGGAIPMVHPDLLDFRPQDEANNAFKKRNYIPERQRALNASTNYKSLHVVEGEKFNDRDPNKKNDFRPVDKKKLLNPPLKYTTSSTKNRVAETISENCRYSLEPANEKMRSDPQFRKNHREKWMSKKDFIMGYKNKTIQPRKNFDDKTSDPFMGGKEKVIAMTSRPLNKTKNISDVEFSSVISKNPSQHNTINNSSLRSLASIMKLKNTGFAGDITEYTKPKFSLNISKSVPKLVEINRNTEDTVQEILADFGHLPTKSFKVRSQLKGTQNRRYKVEKEIDDKDIMEMIINNRKLYHMSAYKVVSKPDIVLRNQKKVKKIHSSKKEGKKLLDEEDRSPGPIDQNLIKPSNAEMRETVPVSISKPVFNHRRLSMQENAHDDELKTDFERRSFHKKKASQELKFPEIKIKGTNFNDRIINDIDLATGFNDFLNRVENDPIEVESARNLDRGQAFKRESSKFNTGSVRRHSPPNSGRELGANDSFEERFASHLANNEDNKSFLKSVHTNLDDSECMNGHTMNMNSMTLTDILRDPGNKKVKILEKMYKNPSMKPEGIKKLVDDYFTK
ncbi:unnamed protein product [Moneuplotes crassus]|uniref:Uncharacterized protein n=1 Tax=Euplotes crassus TaxID=5936 RepID=A0AAD1U0N5_EUPCR|nr:unnamed protein product [Moneuplotes crassus]